MTALNLYAPNNIDEPNKKKDIEFTISVRNIYTYTQQLIEQPNVLFIKSILLRVQYLVTQYTANWCDLTNNEFDIVILLLNIIRYTKIYRYL